MEKLSKTLCRWNGPCTKLDRKYENSAEKFFALAKIFAELLKYLQFVIVQHKSLGFYQRRFMNENFGNVAQVFYLAVN